MRKIISCVSSYNLGAVVKKDKIFIFGGDKGPYDDSPESYRSFPRVQLWPFGRPKAPVEVFDPINETCRVT